MSHLRRRRGTLARVKVPSVTGRAARGVVACRADAGLVFEYSSALFCAFLTRVAVNVVRQRRASLTQVWHRSKHSEEMYPGRVACCPLASHVEYAPRDQLMSEKDGTQTNRQTDRRKLYRYIMLSARRGQLNKTDVREQLPSTSRSMECSRLTVCVHHTTTDNYWRNFK